MGLVTIFKKLLISRGFSTEKDRVTLFGKMDWSMYPSRALAKNLQTIGEKIGGIQGENFLYKLGYDAGEDAGHEMIKYMGLSPKGGWITQNAIIALLQFIGFGNFIWIKKDFREGGDHHIIIKIINNPVIEQSIGLYGPKAMACNFFRGVYAASGEYELGMKNAYFKELRCARKGVPHCVWESKWPRK